MGAEAAIYTTIGAIIVAAINVVGTLIIRKKDDTAGRLKTIEDKQTEAAEKVELGNKGTMTSLKLQLQQTHEKQRSRVASPKDKWSPELDQVFREAYVIYKDLDGNGIIDRLKRDMDIWRDKYADASYIAGK